MGGSFQPVGLDLAVEQLQRTGSLIWLQSRSSRRRELGTMFPKKQDRGLGGSDQEDIFIPRVQGSEKQRYECFWSSCECINLQTPMSLELRVFSLAEHPRTMYFYQQNLETVEPSSPHREKQILCPTFPPLQGERPRPQSWSRRCLCCRREAVGRGWKQR